MYPIILGLPIYVWGGILTLLLMLAASYVAWQNGKGNNRIPFVWHKYLAYAAIAAALMHGLIGLSLYL